MFSFWNFRFKKIDPIRNFGQKLVVALHDKSLIRKIKLGQNIHGARYL